MVDGGSETVNPSLNLPQLSRDRVYRSCHPVGRVTRELLQSVLRIWRKISLQLLNDAGGEVIWSECANRL